MRKLLKRNEGEEHASTEDTNEAELGTMFNEPDIDERVFKDQSTKLRSLRPKARPGQRVECSSWRRIWQGTSNGKSLWTGMHGRT